MEDIEWNPKPRLSDERVREIRSCGVYLLSKAEKEALVDEVLAQRQRVKQTFEITEPVIIQN